MLSRAANYRQDSIPGGNPWRAAPEGVVPVTHMETAEGQKVAIQWRPSDSMMQVYPRVSALVDVPASKRLLVSVSAF